MGMNSTTPSPKNLPGALGSNGVFNNVVAGGVGGFAFTSPNPLPQLSPPSQQMLGPSVYTPLTAQSTLQQQQQPALKRGRYEPDVSGGYDDGDDEGDLSGDGADHQDFDFSGGAQQQYAQHQSGGNGEQDGDQKARPYVVISFDEKIWDTDDEFLVRTGACVRCKNLKVRCEFTTGDPHTCRRCMNGGHECSVPGKKKRKQPP